MQVYDSSSEEDTLRIGRQIGESLEPPLAVLLYGELGSGKTVLARGLAEGLGIVEPALVHSPTFTLVNEYPSRLGLIYHIDLYRLDHLRDLYSIGIEEILSRPAVVIVEWAEKLLLRPEKKMTIRIFTEGSPNHRRLEVNHGDTEGTEGKTKN